MQLLEITSLEWTITFIGWIIVFTALVCLIFVFLMVPRIVEFFTTLELRKNGKSHVADAVRLQAPISGDENAAIALALHLYFNEMHDEESGIITIKRIQRRYSPWSSKIYGLNNTI